MTGQNLGRVTKAIRCPVCFPTCPPGLPPYEHGDYIRFGWARTVRAAARKWGPYPLCDGAAFDALVSDCRAHLERKRDALTLIAIVGRARKATATRPACAPVPLGWGTFAMQGYVRETLHYFFIDRWRKAQRETELPRVAADATGEAVTPNGESWEALSGALDTTLDIANKLAKLPPHQRRVFHARHVERLPWAEILDKYHIRTRTGRRHLRAAERALRAQLA
ncbi:MAG: RNA polymerase sigma factor [Terriglobales bacterium]